MDRRIFIECLCTGLLGGWRTAFAQQSERVVHIGYLRRTSPQPADLAALRQGLRELGYDEGRNLRIEERYADGDAGKLPRLARELLAFKPDVLVVDGVLTVKAVRELAGSTPIVFTVSSDPVRDGLVASLDRPGGTLTGLTNFASELAAKRLQLLRDIVPAVRVGVMYNPPNSSTAVERLADAARSLGVELSLATARDPGELPRAFANLSREKVSALVVWNDAMFFSQRSRIVELSIASRLPTIFPEREFCDSGGLICYGPSISANFRRAAAYIDRILKGAKPADLPIEQPTKFELVVNLKTAKALGLTIPQSVLLRADEVLQ